MIAGNGMLSGLQSAKKAKNGTTQAATPLLKMSDCHTTNSGVLPMPQMSVLNDPSGGHSGSSTFRDNIPSHRPSSHLG